MVISHIVGTILHYAGAPWEYKKCRMDLGPVLTTGMRLSVDRGVLVGLTVSECRSCCWQSRYRNEVCSFRSVCLVVRNTVPPTFSRTHFPLFPPPGLMTEPLPRLCDVFPPGSVELAGGEVAVSPASLSLLLLLLLLLLLRWRQPWSAGSHSSSAVVAIWKRALLFAEWSPASWCLRVFYRLPTRSGSRRGLERARCILVLVFFSPFLFLCSLQAVRFLICAFG